MKMPPLADILTWAPQWFPIATSLVGDYLPIIKRFADFSRSWVKPGLERLIKGNIVVAVLI